MLTAVVAVIMVVVLMVYPVYLVYTSRPEIGPSERYCNHLKGVIEKQDDLITKQRELIDDQSKLIKKIQRSLQCREF